MGKVKKLKEGNEPIRSSIKDNQIVLQIPNKIKKEYNRMFKENDKLSDMAKIVTFAADKDMKGMTRTIIEPRRKLHVEDALYLGATLEVLKNQSAVSALKIEMEKKEKIKQPPIKLKFAFGRDAIDEFKELHSDKLKMTKFKANLDGSADMYFDVSDCTGRMSLVKRTMQICDAVQDVLQGNRHKRDMALIHKAINWLNEVADGVVETHADLVEMSGQDLIKNGYATAVNDDSILGKTLGFFVKLMKGQGNFRYLYFGKEVYPDRKYVVQLKTPYKMDEPKKANHAENIRLSYEYGEQQFAGAGLMMINKYSKEITDAINARIDEENDKK